MSYTLQQILALAPDDASAKAGMQLAAPAKWPVKCINERALWGECQGSGSKPYKTWVDLTSIAFKCSCPSRKFPCKHGLGLLILHADKADLFSASTEIPQELDEWLSKRSAKADEKIKTEKKPVDEGAQQKRIDSREQKILHGIDELQTWIKDIVRTGMVNIQPHSYNFAATITSRMIDCQAPGLAYQLRKINSINFYNERWHKEFLKLLSKIYILCEGYKRKNTISSQVREDLELLIGWTKSKEEILHSETLSDEWLVLSKTAVQEDALTTETMWLYGIQTERFASVLNFYTSATKPMDVLVTGTVIEADLAFYPGAFPLRSLIKEQRNQATVLPNAIKAFKTINDVKEHVTQVLSLAPFTDRIPLLLETFTIVPQGSYWFLKDDSGIGLQLSNTDFECWKILSISQGLHFSCFAVYENESLDIHSLLTDNNFHTVK